MSVLERPGGRRTAEAVPGAQLVVLPDADHVSSPDQPERTRAILLDRLARRRDQPGA